MNCISATSSPQILSMKGEYTFLLLNFLRIALCNSFTNSLSEIFLFLMPRPEAFYQRTDGPLKQGLFDIHHILDF